VNGKDISPPQNMTCLKESCQTYIDLSKLVISLSTGVFILVPTLLGISHKRFIKKKLFLNLGLIAMGVSIFVGLHVISSLAAIQRAGTYDIANTLTMTLSQIQWITFLLGIIPISIFILSNLFKVEQEKEEMELILVGKKANLELAKLYKERGECDKAVALLEILVGKNAGSGL
jgi:hypothetical protein